MKFCKLCSDNTAKCDGCGKLWNHDSFVFCTKFVHVCNKDCYLQFYAKRFDEQKKEATIVSFEEEVEKDGEDSDG